MKIEYGWNLRIIVKNFQYNMLQFNILLSYSCIIYERELCEKVETLKKYNKLFHQYFRILNLIKLLTKK